VSSYRAGDGVPGHVPDLLWGERLAAFIGMVMRTMVRLDRPHHADGSFKGELQGVFRSPRVRVMTHPGGLRPRRPVGAEFKRRARPVGRPLGVISEPTSPVCPPTWPPVVAVAQALRDLGLEPLSDIISLLRADIERARPSRIRRDSNP